MPNEILFDLKNVAMYYPERAALPWKRRNYWSLKDVSFSVRRGENLAVIGRNGAGKTSLLRILAGIIEPDKGTIYRQKVRRTTLSFGAGFEPRLTGRQNIMLNGLQLGMPRDYIRSRTQQIIDLANIGEFIDQPVRTYSTGMRARLGFSIAHFISTDVLLIDEVLAAGDEPFRRTSTALIKERIASDLTVILVSHDMALVREVCSRVIQIENGYSLPELPVDETILRYSQTTRKI